MREVMTINKAVDRIAWRLSQLKTNQNDQEALDCIIEYINLMDETGWMENLLFGKLFVHLFMMYAESGNYDAAGCVLKIEEILSTPLEEKVSEMALKVPYFKFEYILHKFMRPTDPFNFDQVRRERLRVLKQNRRDLELSLKTEYTPEQAKDFVKNQVSRLSKLYNQEKFA